MVTCRVMPHLKPFRALRYDPGTVGPLDAVVSPPHDVVTPDRREALITASPYNAVRLLNPESPAEAARLVRAWKAEGASSARMSRQSGFSRRLFRAWTVERGGG